MTLHELHHGVKSGGIGHPTFLCLHTFADFCGYFLYLMVVPEHFLHRFPERRDRHLRLRMAKARLELCKIAHIDVQLLEVVDQLYQLVI